jgi:hypothetical protein
VWTKNCVNWSARRSNIGIRKITAEKEMKIKYMIEVVWKKDDDL